MGVGSAVRELIRTVNHLPAFTFRPGWGDARGSLLRRRGLPAARLTCALLCRWGLWAAVGERLRGRSWKARKLGQNGGENLLGPEWGARRRPGGPPTPGGAVGVGPTRWRGAAGDHKPTGPHCSPVTLPLALLPLSNTLLSGFLLSPFQRGCLLFSSQPGCFHFFCLKFLRGRFYFQRFD